MAEKDFIERDGTVIETLPNGQFKIKIDTPEGESYDALGYVSGKIRRFNIKILLGDKVKAEFSKYDNKHCRIVYRYK